MPSNDNDAFSQFIRKLDQLGTLDESDRAAVRSLPFQSRTVPRHHLIVREGERATDCCILLSGYACRHKTTQSGGRQIVSFHIPGDILDLQHLLLDRADHSVQSITEVRIAMIPAVHIKRLAETHTSIADALWRDSLIEASIFREWVLNVGRRDAKQRVAHMLCEFASRRENAGQGSPERFEFPMSQEQIADATGLTPVHVNRMLAALDKDGVIVRNNREVEITDWTRMQQIADFNPAYLHAAA